ncbi:3-isopropylmalate dehydratase small subunit [Halobacterium yunchengense]|uniref:3-isopropylmalate dehydratase small subunit n=1 Tax=Halobacterium yunchengense TaxID=3108497 RepID=UPI003008DC20
MSADASDGDGGPAEIVEQVTGTGVPVRGNDIDTDEIIPARFLKVVTFDGLGQFAFFDVRFDSATPEESRDGDGEAVGVDEPKDHPFNDQRFQGANVLAVNANFGCGSSREHAPQALMRWGIDAIVGESFAEIFAGNCLALGIPTVTASQDDVEALQDFVDDNPDAEIEVDVVNEEVRYGDATIDAEVGDAQRRALVEGVWDTTALMRSNADTVKETAASLPYTDV